MRQHITYPCGCINELHPTYQVLYCVEKCRHHKFTKSQQPVGREYYESLGCFENGIPQCRRYVCELLDALGANAIPYMTYRKMALTIGCGIGGYTSYMFRRGYEVIGVDTDQWACEYMCQAYAVLCHWGRFEDVQRNLEDNSFELIFSAHCIEHMEDFYTTFLHIKRLLNVGGSFVFIVPNDEDPVNPDHKWFFTEQGLIYNLERLGFSDIQMVTKRRIDREQFIYCKCVCDK